MGMGRRRREVQQELWVATASLPDVPRHVFYEKLNRLLAQSDSDTFVEELCEPYYAVNVGRDSIPPGRYFRMLFVGYFELERGDASLTPRHPSVQKAMLSTSGPSLALWPCHPSLVVERY